MKKCPLTRKPCMEKDCAWWITYECVIKKIGEKMK